MGRNGGAQETPFLIRNTVKDTSTEAVIVQESLWKSNLAKTKPPLLHPKRLLHHNSLLSLVILTEAMPVHQATAASPLEVNISILLQNLYLTTEEFRYILPPSTYNPRNLRLFIRNTETTTTLLSLDTYPLIRYSTRIPQRPMDHRSWISAATKRSIQGITITILGLKS
jgi:hypothetical protein